MYSLGAVSVEHTRTVPLWFSSSKGLALSGVNLFPDIARSDVTFAIVAFPDVTFGIVTLPDVTFGIVTLPNRAALPIHLDSTPWSFDNGSYFGIVTLPKLL